MGKDEVCEVCGGTETKLVDGYYYCVECGTQDTNVRETLVELQMLGDGNFAVGRRTKFSIKRQEGVEMSLEWYKWHTYNFELAGLTEQLIELGAAPSLRMKVLWIWSRYIKMFQKKEELSRFKALSQLEESSSSSAGEEGEAEGEGAGAARFAGAGRSRPRLDCVNRHVLVAILALALNHDRSPLQVSHVARLVLWRLLAVNDALRFVPRDVRPRRALRKQLRHPARGALFVCGDLSQVGSRNSPLQVSHVARLVLWRLLAVNDALRFVPRDVRPRRALRKQLRHPARGALFVCGDLSQVGSRNSPLQVSHVARLVLWRLLAVNDALRFVPRDVRPRRALRKQLRHPARGALFVCGDLSQVGSRNSPLQVSHVARLVLWRLLAVNDALRFVPRDVRPRRALRKQLRHPARGALFVCGDLSQVGSRNSPLQVSHVARLVLWRLLAVNDALRFVPRDVRPRRLLRKQLRHPARGALFVCGDLSQVMGRLSRMLELGPPRVPDVEALLDALLSELRLPRGLAPLVRALMRLLPLPWEWGARLKEAPRHPDYDTVLGAYVLVALKMCFGLDDDCEVRMSDAVDRINREERRPRALTSDPEPTRRLFSFREWAAHVRRRALLLSRQYGPFAWQRNMRTTDEALLEHFDEFTVAEDKKKGKSLLSDQVTMDILGKMPRRHARLVRPLEELRRAAAAPAPALALSRRVAREELDEDFTRYDVAYACRGLALGGVADAGKLYRRRIAEHLRNPEADATIVYVKDWENKNWAKTKRPTVAHVVGEGDPGRDSRGPGAEPGDEREPETFEEEAEGGNIFDDDLVGLKIKEEKVEAPEALDIFNDEMKDINVFDDETKDINVFDDFGDELENPRRGSAVFDSDEEGGARYDPGSFDRAATIKQIMIAAYKKYIVIEAKFPIRFRTAPRPPNEKSVPKRVVENNNRPEAWVGKHERREGKAAIGDVVTAYQSSLARDAMRQVAEEVQRYVDAVESPDLDPPDLGPPEPGEPGDGDPDESRDVEVIENADKNADKSDDSVDEAAYDPVYKGDAKFDEKTHDASQLFLKLNEGPAPPSPSPAPAPSPGEDDSFLDKQLDDDALQEEKRRRCLERMKMKAKWRKKKKNIDHLVDDPESIPKFNYWFKHYEQCRSWMNTAVQVEIDSSFPRSFRFVLRECAAVLGVAPGALYRRACDVERVLLSLLWRPKPAPTPTRKRRRRPSASGSDRQPDAKTSRTSANKAKVSKNNKNNEKASRRYSKLTNYTSDDSSDWVVSSDDASLPRGESENEGVSKENIVPDEEPGAAPRRSGRIRRRAAPDSWR